MATPTLSGSLDKSSYAPGETMVATLSYADEDNHVENSSVQWTATDAAGNSVNLTLNYAVNSVDPVALSYTDASGRVWTKQSDNGTVAVFTATA